MGPTDGDLVQKATAGDLSAFEALVERYYADCLRFAVHSLGDRADAEEVVQDTFVRAYRALERYEDRQRFKAWLFSILANRCRSSGARAQRRRRLLQGYRLEPADAATGPVADPDRGETLRRIHSALGELPAQQREAFLLHHVAGAGYEEMSDITGAGVSALKMRVKRAREQLAELLRDLDE
ncbi:MAG: RNA polymerase sigma factor [Gemmatimonadetes bacterium]|uniref:RNA polymerase sigma factor n=1 Tax=Candidatus Kutchimonas denitrificans TaxID=3056748 RepID=A0AAE5CB41_9BACT|nr:RNA polymerase sigma factor [Gemmatimonadota bacterium]NIR74073.1 RNA polymerase sigma factor [Candidatus Kutchimonas denitrificans]NIS01635.1 RNA polymerase sigma factor [Gemmatimonadota bacterium]NIT67373.1 RNA polymerase sigma factor [Gemmatimonadota bacterium]NIU52736.1 sigma-70 family RNA polymerase sigma factor [Gemmatimonadota bacterium]